MPRYYFHLVSPKNPVRDAYGVELPGLDAAHWHAMHLVYRLRAHAAETGEDWVIEVSDESGAVPLVVLPRAVPMLRQSHQRRDDARSATAATSSRYRPGRRVSAPENPAPRP